MPSPRISLLGPLTDQEWDTRGACQGREEPASPATHPIGSGESRLDADDSPAEGSAMTAPADQHRRRRLPRRLVAVVVVVAVIGVALWSVLRAGEPFAPGTKPFSANGIALSYPAGWILHDQGWSSTGLGSTFAIVGTQPWGLCLPVDLNCHDSIRLEPSQISVELGSGILGGSSVCEVGRDRSDLAGRGPDDPPADRIARPRRRPADARHRLRGRPGRLLPLGRMADVGDRRPGLDHGDLPDRRALPRAGRRGVPPAAGRACRERSLRRVRDAGRRRPVRLRGAVSVGRWGAGPAGALASTPVAAQVAAGVSVRRPSTSAKSHASIAGGSIPSVVSAVQIWLRWSVP